MLQEAVVGVLGWRKHKHAGVEAVWPADITHCCQLRVGEEVVGVLYALQEEEDKWCMSRGTALTYYSLQVFLSKHFRQCKIKQLLYTSFKTLPKNIQVN